MDGAFKKGFPREQDHMAPVQPELREHHPSTFEKIKNGLNSVGGAFGYPDLAERTGETIDLVSLPSMLGAFGPAAAVRAGAGPAWDAAMAKVLERRHPNDISALRNGQSLKTDRTRAEVYDRAAGGIDREAWLHAPNEIPEAAIAHATGTPQWAPGAVTANDTAAISADSQKYLSQLMAQRNRGAFKAVK
jgi:hypothetical protein